MVTSVAISLCYYSLRRLSCLLSVHVRAREVYHIKLFVCRRVCMEARVLGLKVGHKYNLAGTMCSSRQKISTLYTRKIRIKHRHYKTHDSFGFMINVWLVLCAVVTIIIRTLVPVESKLVLRFSAT